MIVMFPESGMRKAAIKRAEMAPRLGSSIMVYIVVAIGRE